MLILYYFKNCKNNNLLLTSIFFDKKKVLRDNFYALNTSIMEKKIFIRQLKLYKHQRLTNHSFPKHR